MAAAVRGGDVAGVVFHSDKGGEYVGELFARACQALGVTQSMGRVGDSFDCEHDPPAWRVSATTLVGCQQAAA